MPTVPAGPTTYAVNLCTAHPDMDGFDHCSTGSDFATEAEARAVFEAADPIRALAEAEDLYCSVAEFCTYHRDISYVWLDGPGVTGVRKLREPPKRSSDHWKREAAMQAGMAFGCDGYNDEMGY